VPPATSSQCSAVGDQSEAKKRQQRNGISINED